jgi:hypothetical protein
MIFAPFEEAFEALIATGARIKDGTIFGEMNDL